MSNAVLQAILALQQGQMIIVTDDVKRENEGDLVMAAEKATPEAITFMAKKGSGLICLALTGGQLDQLELPDMVQTNRDPHQTAFTVSIDAAVDITTGISAADRAKTILLAADPATKANQLRSPGHIFPLRAKLGGVLTRPGHTEAAVDLASLAGLWPAGVICEIMGDDGQMLRGEQLNQFAAVHHLPIISIEELIAYRRRQATNRCLLQKQSTTSTILPTPYGSFQVYHFVNNTQHEPHLALIMGDIWGEDPPLVRIHSECLTGDIFGSLRCDCGQQLNIAMQRISEEGRGIIIYLRQEGRGIGLSNKLKAYALQDQGLDTVEANEALGFLPDQRDYNAAITILETLALTRLRLLTNNPAKLAALNQWQPGQIERVPIITEAVCSNYHYLTTKQHKMNHLLGEQ